MKKALSIILTLVMVLTMIPVFSITANAETNVCKIGSTEYSTIGEALSKVEDETSTTITLIGDSVENIDIAENKIVTIDLNGYVIKADLSDEARHSVITNNGTLTIEDSNAAASTHYFGDKNCVHGTTVGEECIECSSCSHGTMFGDYCDDCSSTVTEEQISVKKNAEADGLYETYYSAKPADMTGVLTVSGGCITGGSGENGGAIYNIGTLTINSGNIVGNYADYGGGINNTQTLKINGGAIIGNKAKSDGGGIISCDSSNLTINNCKLDNNTADCGGALYTSIGCEIEGCTIMNNFAADSGGGMYLLIKRAEKHVSIKDSTVTGNKAQLQAGGIYCKERAECFVGGTKITMSDGTKKNIEDVKVGDYVRTFDHESGTLSTERVFLVFAKNGKRNIATLHFTDGIELGLVGEHAFLEKDSFKYVTITSDNAKSYVGKWFYNASAEKWEQLLSVSHSTKECSYYALVTEHHFNCITNDMLTVVYEASVLLNLYELDSNLKADADALQADIQNYGLRNFKACSGVTEEEYDISNMKYLDIIIGKSICTEEYFMSMVDFAKSIIAEPVQCKQFIQNSDNSKSSLMNDLNDNPINTSVSGVTTGTPSSLVIGSNVTVRNNTVGNNENNLYLESEIYCSIDPDSQVENIDVGVTMNDEKGQFTSYGNENDINYFHSDNNTYYVKFVEGNTDVEQGEATYNDHLELAEAKIKISNEIENGTIEVSDQGAESGTVTVKVTPAEGYEIDKIIVTDKDNNDITDDVLNGEVLTLPDASKLPITISATFNENSLSIFGLVITGIAAIAGFKLVKMAINSQTFKPFFAIFNKCFVKFHYFNRYFKCVCI